MAKKFSDEVLKLVAKIPRRRLTTYGALAAALGRPRAARAVGAALARNPKPIEVPCHRVVCADGTVGGYLGSARGARRKAALLASEGIKFRKAKVVGLQQLLWP